jgi:TetR/AcrR family transcriptional regulator, fatty acid metabolism regulator protein
MHRVVVLGRGGAGKTVLSGRVAAAIGAPLVELDTLFWQQADLQPLSPGDWVRVQREHLSATRWVADGDLGPYDVVSVRLRAADAVVVLDYSLPRCVWRALRRSRERRDFWSWVFAYRRRYLPQLVAAIHEHASHASVQILHNPRETSHWLGTLSHGGDGQTFTGRARREQIVASAIEVIAEGGYAQASVAKIAARVGISKSVVLHHFDSKDAIVMAIVMDVATRGARQMLPAMAAAATAMEELAAYIRVNCRFIDENRQDSLAMLDILTSYRSENGQRLDEVLAAGTAPPGDDLSKLDPVSIFARGVGSGEFPPLSPVLSAVAVRASIDGMVWTLAREPTFDIRGYAEELVTHHERAIGRRP